MDDIEASVAAMSCVGVMPNHVSNGQQGSCHPLLAALLLVITFGGAWCVTSSTAARIFVALRDLVSWG